jgi:hypothetical protein
MFDLIGVPYTSMARPGGIADAIGVLREAGLQSEDFPAADYLQPGGLTWADLGEIASEALADPRCLGVSLVIYNPDLDPDARPPRGSCTS